MTYNDDEKPPAPTSNAGSTPGGGGFATVGLVKMDWSLDKDEAPLTADTVQVMVELRGSSSAAVREGLDLVAVLDVSGSMEGDKLNKMKTAMQFVIKKLTPIDRLSVVTFNNAATRQCPLRSMSQGAQSDLKAIVDGLTAGGGTNIKAGLETGLAVLAGRVHTTCRTVNILLMSDGQQNDGDARQVDPGNVPIYTFGFGKDTDHQLLTDIATKSPGGTFSTVADGGDMNLAFSQLLGGLLTVVVQDLELTLTPKDDTVKIEKVDPGSYQVTTKTDPSSGVVTKFTITFGTLYSGETRKVIVDLTLLDITDIGPFDPELFELQNSYSAQGGRKYSPADVVDIKRIKNASGAADGAGRTTRQLQVELARRQHADSISKARALADGEKMDDARYKLSEAQNAVENILDQANPMVDMLRAELQQLYALMESVDLYKEQGRPYALSSETSHGRQRFAARGDVEAVRLFSTPRMDAYLEQAKQFNQDPDAPLPSAADDTQQEIAANPLATIAGPLAFYIDSAIRALQAIGKIVNATTGAA